MGSGGAEGEQEAALLGLAWVLPEAAACALSRSPGVLRLGEFFPAGDSSGGGSSWLFLVDMSSRSGASGPWNCALPRGSFSVPQDSAQSL